MTVPDLGLLAYFVEIARTRSLTRASVGLDVSQSVLSRSIQRLERTMGQRLLQRTGRGVTLTEFGQAVLPEAQGLLAAAARFTDLAVESAGKPSGRVVIGLPGSVAAMTAGALFRETKCRYPLVSLRLVEGLSGAIEESLLIGRLDIGVFYTPRTRARRGEVPLAVSDLCLVGAKGDPITARPSVGLAALARCTLALPSQPHALRALVEGACAKGGVKLKPPLEVDSLATMKAIAESGTCHTVCTYDAVSREVEAGRLQAARFNRPVLSRLLVMALAPKHSLTIATRHVSDLVCDIVYNEIGQGRWRARRA